MNRIDLLSAVILISLTTVACGSGDGAIICEGEDSVCPEPLRCNDEGFCVGDPDPTECDTLGDGELCESGNGSCDAGECVAFVCEDGVLDANEFCDGPAEEANCADEAFGYDFGVPSCSGDCSKFTNQSCGLLGFRRIAGGVSTNQVSDLFATKDEIWAVGSAGGYHHDGVVWRRDERLTGLSIDGTGADDLWIVDQGTVRNIRGDQVTEVELGATAVAVVSADSVYAAGHDAVTDTPTIWHYDGTEWSPFHVGAAGERSYNAIEAAGTTVLATRQGFATVVEAGAVREIPEMAIGNLVSMWARSADDFYIVASDGIYHYDGVALASRFASSGGNLIRVSGFGDSTLIFGGGPFPGPGLMREHRIGRPDNELRRLAGLGILQSLPPIVGPTYVVASHSADRLVLALNDGDIFEWRGAGFSFVDFNIGQGVPSTLRDMERIGDDIYVAFGPTGSQRIGVVTDAFENDPQLSAVAVTSVPFNVFGRSPDEIYFTSGTGLSLLEGTTETLVQAGTFNEIAVAGPDRALAVGANGAAFLFDGIDWDDVSIPAAGTFVSAFAAPDGFIAGDGTKGLHVFRDGSWSSITTSAALSMTSIAGASTRDFYAAGNGGSFFHCRELDGPLSCEPVGPSTSLNFRAIAVFSSSDILVAAGEEGLHFNGVRWSRVRFPTGRVMTQILGDADRLWLGSSQGRALERLERSTSWSAVPQ